MSCETQVLYEFGSFRLDPGQRTLMCNGELVALAPKGLDTLLFLVQNSGRVVEKDELMKTLWPDSFVEEGNLTQNIFVLRKTLGDENGSSFIKTISRRGYKFVASVRPLDIPTHATQSSLPAEYWRGHSPFRSLRAFEQDDAWLFFGRNSETQELLLRLSRSQVLVVTGNSGCGKSSLVRAGLIPALRKGSLRHGDEPSNFSSLPHPTSTPSENPDSSTSPHARKASVEALDSWRVAVIRPSASPFDYVAEVLPNQLAPELDLVKQAEFIANCRSKLPLGGDTLRDAIAALANGTTRESSQTRILLAVDQFEELFTLTVSRQIRERYIDALLAASQREGSVPVHLILILRADFYSHCLEHPGLSRCLESNLYNVPRMTPEQLRLSIEKRLAAASAHAESGLTDSLLDDVGAEPGNLALLEHALGQLWDKCGGFGCALTNGAYAAMGRLRGALGRHADEVYDSIGDEKQKQLAKRILLELVHLGEGAQDTRRRIRRSDLLSLGTTEDLEPLLARLISSRLVSTGLEGGETFVEVSHEALIREWPALCEWLAQNREELKLERRLNQAAREWEELGRDGGALLQGARLAHAEEWLDRHANAAFNLKQLVKASVDARVEIQVRELAQHKELLRQAEARAQAERELGEQQASAAMHAQRSAEQLRQTMTDLERSYDITLEALGDALDLKYVAYGETKRVTAFTIVLARAIGLLGARIRPIARGAFLHNIGKLAVPDGILLKPGPLNHEETRIMREHCLSGYRVLKKIPFLAEAAEIVYAQEEKFDGTGYPRGLKGKNIPLGARIFSIVSAFNAIISDRKYRAAQSIATAREEIKRFSGTQFDPELVSVFLQVPDTVWEDLIKVMDDAFSYVFSAAQHEEES